MLSYLLVSAVYCAVVYVEVIGELYFCVLVMMSHRLYSSLYIDIDLNSTLFCCFQQQPVKLLLSCTLLITLDKPSRQMTPPTES